MGCSYEVTFSKKHRGKKPSEIPVGEVWTGFMDKTTAHGVPHIRYARGYIKKTFWVLASLACVGGLIHQGTVLIEKYLAADVAVKVTVIHAKAITFPAVTICNNNPLFSSKVLKNAEIREIFGLPDPDSQDQHDSTSDGDSENVRERNLAESAFGLNDPEDSSQSMDQQNNVRDEDIDIRAKNARKHVRVGFGLMDRITTSQLPLQKDTATDGEAVTSGTRKGTLGLGRTSSADLEATSQTTIQQNTTATAHDANFAHAASNKAGREFRLTHPEATPLSPDEHNHTSTEDAPMSGRLALGGFGLTRTEGTLQTPVLQNISRSGDPVRVENIADNVAQIESANEGDELGQQKGFKIGKLLKEGKRHTRASFEQSLELMQVTAAMSTEAKLEMGQPISDLIVDCEYAGTACNVSTDFTFFYNSFYGNCYTFNSNWDRNKLIGGKLSRSYRPGPKYGLSLMFHVDQDEYIGELAQSAGVKVVIHSQKRMPFPEDEGIAVSPGFQTFVGLSKVSIDRQGDRYGDCTSSETTDHKRNVYEEIHPVQYSSPSCYKTCYQYHVVTACGCGDPQYPINGSFIEYRPVMPCNFSSIEDADCMNNMQSRYQNDSLECKCPTACSETTFKTHVSMDAWPSKRYQLSSLISNMGGILGLFIGFSFLTIGEFLELGMDVMIVLFLKLCYNHKTEPQRQVKRGTSKSAPSANKTRATKFHNFFTTSNSIQPDDRTIDDNW